MLAPGNMEHDIWIEGMSMFLPKLLSCRIRMIRDTLSVLRPNEKNADQFWTEWRPYPWIWQLKLKYLILRLVTFFLHQCATNKHFWPGQPFWWSRIVTKLYEIMVYRDLSNLFFPIHIQSEKTHVSERWLVDLHHKHQTLGCPPSQDSSHHQDSEPFLGSGIPT